MEHFLTTAEQQSLLGLRWKLIFVLQIQLDSFLHLLTGERGKINLILLSAYYLEQSGLKSEQWLWNSCWLISMESLHVSF